MSVNYQITLRTYFFLAANHQYRVKPAIPAASSITIAQITRNPLNGAGAWPGALVRRLPGNLPRFMETAPVGTCIAYKQSNCK